jgi:hypothetical protein
MKYRLALLLCLFSCVTGLVLTPASSLAAPPAVNPVGHRGGFLLVRTAAVPGNEGRRQALSGNDAREQQGIGAAEGNTCGRSRGFPIRIRASRKSL